MRKLTQFWNTVHSSRLVIATFLLLACFLAYGVFATQLGFYQDDWNFVYYVATGGMPSLVEFFDYDGHPTGAWSYVLSFALLGFNPAAWQIYSLLWRFLSMLTFWLVLDALWPERKAQTLTAAIIFAVYPVFYLQAQAVSYFEVWMSFAFLWLSFLWNIKSLRHREKAIQFSALAILMKIAHSFTTEYTWGLELARPAFLWIALNRSGKQSAGRVLEVAKSWSPYLLIFLAKIVWRGLFYVSPDVARSEPSLIFQFFQDPVGSFNQLLANGLPDLVLLQFTGWYKILQPSMLDLTIQSNLIIVLVTALSALLVWGFLAGFAPPGSDGTVRIEAQFLLAGLAALVVGLLPFYAAGYFITAKLEPWNGRFALGSMPGIALITVSLVSAFVSDHRRQLVVFAILTGLSIGWQFRISNQFRWAWDRQVDFYTQLALRAPQIAPGTSILSEAEFLSYMGGYPTALAVNTLYAQSGEPYVGSNDPKYWFFPLSDFLNSLPEKLEGRTFTAQRAAVEFEGQPQGSILVSFESEFNQCLWTLSPEHSALKAISQTNRQLATISYLDRIEQVSLSSDSFVWRYINPEPERDWCFYYQQADLAYQYAQWEQVLQLWGEARSQGLKPENGFEYLPFIEAHAHQGDWEIARELTRFSKRTMQGIDPLLCSVWERLASETPAGAQKDAALSAIRDDLGCSTGE